MGISWLSNMSLSKLQDIVKDGRDCADHNKLWKILKEMGIQTTWPASWEICMQIKKQLLELDMEQQTGFKSGKPAYCHPAYLTYMQITSCEVPDWMKHKLESGLLGETSITSDTQMTPPLWKKAKKN